MELDVKCNIDNTSYQLKIAGYEQKVDQIIIYCKLPLALSGDYWKDCSIDISELKKGFDILYERLEALERWQCKMQETFED